MYGSQGLFGKGRGEPMNYFRSGPVRLLLVMGAYSMVCGLSQLLPLPWWFIGFLASGFVLGRYAKHILTWINAHEVLVARELVAKWIDAMIDLQDKRPQPIIVVVPKGTEEIQH